MTDRLGARDIRAPFDFGTNLTPSFLLANRIHHGIFYSAFEPWWHGEMVHLTYQFFSINWISFSFHLSSSITPPGQYHWLVVILNFVDYMF